MVQGRLRAAASRFHNMSSSGPGVKEATTSNHKVVQSCLNRTSRSRNTRCASRSSSAGSSHCPCCTSRASRHSHIAVRRAFAVPSAGISAATAGAEAASCALSVAPAAAAPTGSWPAVSLLAKSSTSSLQELQCRQQHLMVQWPDSWACSHNAADAYLSMCIGAQSFALQFVELYCPDLIGS
jgi:hypothetical protein